MRIGLLGPLEITDDRCQLRLPGQKLRTVMATLALNPGRVVATYELIDELWAEDPPRNAENSLHAHIARLRKLLGTHVGKSGAHDLLQTVQGGYLLQVASDAVDAHQFNRAVEQARELGPGQAVTVARLLGDALALWRGPALLDVGDGVSCRVAAVQLEEMRLSAQEDLIDARLALGLHNSQVPELERLTARYPLRERFSEQLMLALYRCGRQAEAVDVYQRARYRLAAELGLEPGRGLRTRLQEVLRHDPVLWHGTATTVTLPDVRLPVH